MVNKTIYFYIGYKSAELREYHHLQNSFDHTQGPASQKSLQIPTVHINVAGVDSFPGMPYCECEEASSALAFQC
jgi:hypothetical protein